MIKAVITTSLAALMSAWAAPEVRAQAQTQTVPAPANPIVGAWRILEVTRDSAGIRVTRAHPGVYLFTQRHYSVTRIDSEKPRRDFPSELRRTTETYVDIWGPFAAHSGTYEVQGDRLTMRAVVAKNPAAMQPTNFNTHTWRVAGDTLWLQNVANSTGRVTDGTLVKLVRAER